MKIKRILSFGAGVNTGALLCLLRLKKIKIDEAVFADTGCEDDATYNWINKEAKPYLEKEGIKFTVVKSHLGNMYDYYFERKCMPFITRKDCTDKFKIRPIKKYIEKTYHKDCVICYIGYDAGEPQRAKSVSNIKKKYIVSYPLIEYGIDRYRCKKLIQALELRIPPKSRCFFCPNRKEEGFYQLWKYELHNFEKAMALEENQRHFGKKKGYCLLFNDKKKLRILMNKWKTQRRLVSCFPIPSLMIEDKRGLNLASNEGI